MWPHGLGREPKIEFRDGEWLPKGSAAELTGDGWIYHRTRQEMFAAEFEGPRPLGGGRGERAFIATMQASIVNVEGGMRRNQEEEARKQFWMHKIWVHLD